MKNPYAAPVSVDAVGRQSIRNGSSLTKHFPNSSIVLCTAPLLHYVFVWVHWLSVSAILGEPARPGIHDPKNFLLGVLSYLGIGLMIFSFAVAPAVVIIGFRRNSIVQHLVTYIACLVGTTVLFRLDIMQITSWITD